MSVPVSPPCLGESFTYSHDGAGNLLSFSRWSGSAVEVLYFVYNSDGDRTSQTVDGVTKHYVIDIAAPLTMVLTGTPAKTQRCYHV